MAIVWAVRRSKDFLVGRKFTLVSDHQPLQFLFHSRKEIPKVTSARIQRWTIELMGMDYEIKYCQGKRNLLADAMSRLQFQDNAEEDMEMVHDLIHWENNTVSLNDIKEETQRVVMNDWKNCLIK